MSVWSWGLGRPRTKLGKFLDRHGITQEELRSWSGVSRATITRLCGDKEYVPSKLTRRSIINALDREGFDVYEDDFWP